MPDDELDLVDKIKWGLAVDHELVEGHAVKIFLPVQKCSPKCPAYKDCDHVKRGRCLAIVNFLSLVLVNYTDREYGIGDRLTPFEMDAVTLRLMPLYHQLAAFELNQYSMDMKDTFYTTDKGTINTHPVFREIRVTIDAINKLEKELGLDVKWRSKFGKKLKGAPSIEEAIKADGKSNAGKTLYQMQTEQ